MTALSARFARVQSAIVLAALLLLVPFVSNATIEVPYQQYDHVHCRYDRNERNDPDAPDEDPKKTELRFETVSPGGSATTVASLTIPETGSVRLQATTLVDTAELGSWTFRFSVFYDDGSSQIVEQVSIELVDSFSGTMLLSDDLGDFPDESASAGVVSIPAGITLDLAGKTINGGTLNVTGEMDLESAAAFSGTRIVYRKSIHLNSPPTATYAFTVDGSGISGGDGLTVLPWGAEVELFSIQNLVLDWQAGTGTFSVTSCAVDFGNAWDLLAGGIEAEFQDCTFNQDSLYIRNNDRVVFNGSDNVFQGGLTVNLGGSTGHLEMNDAVFVGPLTVQGSQPATCLFNRCEFTEAVFLWNRLPVEFTNNLFRKDIMIWGEEWATSTKPGPVIEGNDFLGQTAFYLMTQYTQTPVSPIQVGTNFYGSAEGLVHWPWDGGFPSSRFLSGRGARVWGQYVGAPNPGPLLLFAPPTDSPSWTEIRNKKTIPRVRIMDWILGQGSVSHNRSTNLLLEGVDFFLSLDAWCDAPEVEGAVLYVKMNGTEYPSTKPGKKITRALEQFSNRQIIRGESTINFILPVPDDGITSLQVWLDTRNVTGYDEPGENVLLQDLTPSVLGLARKDVESLNIPVIPVKLLLLGYLTTPAPSAPAFINEIEPYFRTMLPVASKNVKLEPTITVPFTGLVSNVPWIGTYTLTNAIATWFQLSGEITHLLESAFGKDPVDYAVALIPPGGLGKGIQGANLAGRRGVLLVDADYPSATFHELGHALGLYITEQYDTYPPDGLRTEGCTIFKKEDGYAPGFAGDQGRIMHLPDPLASWYEIIGLWDIMSKEDLTIWPIPSTWDQMFTALRSVLSGRRAQLATERSPLPPGMRALTLHGAVQQVPGQTYYEFVPGSLSAFPAEGVDQNALIVAPVPEGIEDKYEFSGYDASGNRLDHDTFRLVPNNGAGPARDLWWANFVIANSSVVRYEITRSSDGTVVFACNAGGTLTTEILEPQPGATLTGDVTVRWRTVASPRHRSELEAPVTHMLYASRDGGTTWNVLLPYIEDDEVVITSDLIPSIDGLALRVVATDGLRTASHDVTGLKLPNHDPLVLISSPRDGDHAPEETPWRLQGSAWDPDDRTYLEGSWTSSLQGALANENTPEEIVLIPGTHTLTFASTDALGATGSAAVQVLVGPAPDGADLSLEPTALALRPPDITIGASESNVVVQPGQEHAFSLLFRNQGFPREVDLRLFVQEPAGGGETLLAEERYDLGSFEEAILHGAFVPSGLGEYLFRGEVLPVDGLDPEMGNNEQTWRYHSRLGVVMWVAR